MKTSHYLLVILTLFLLVACLNSDPNLDNKGKDELKSLEIDREIDETTMLYSDTVYVPIYSDIYIDQHTQKCLLAATLSIRNTSYTDSLFISKIDYFDTDGNLVRSFLKNSISLPPMATINYVIEKEDDTGGGGANFIVALYAKAKIMNPIIQAIMIGENGNKGFGFTTEGQSINK